MGIRERSQDTFWVTTGLYPQEFVITFQALMNINTVRIQSFNVRKITVGRSVSNEPTEFELLREKDVESTDGQLQEEEIHCGGNLTAQHLKFTIQSGYDHFATIHQVHVDGNAVHS
ncbi:intraflagellar transport protein 25 homolog isoform X3 [Lingula anatina]|uniref:Intraflagellar transport protein 25 homolog isoform X3 n=1 Tax=Lingula anatina TaxID=7574 RepID=A0A1S3JPU3_LINAN|nr:intraflagellar transport protein 25 homolog isoform X3 [Lingula anatina]|eukprot:XP_013412156.1 intraflagellar transport protein 25 homolog isoform X3 [Lingula anatina]